MRIRQVQRRDAAALQALQQQVSPDMRGDLLAVAAAPIQVAEIRGGVVGYAAALPVPGLPDNAELVGGVLPVYRRQGIGWALLQALREHLPHSYHCLTFAIAAENAPATSFLQAAGFTVHHEEWEMVWQGGDASPLLPALPFGFTSHHLDGKAAAPLFRHLYDTTFSPHPWYQPYSDDELFSLFPHQGQPHFLYHQHEPVAFIWYWLEGGKHGVIEPVGVIPAYQGQGLGRQMLYLALANLTKQGARQVKIGTWQKNAAAIHLYHSLGFHHTQTITHWELRW
ncbi:MAG: GNAT family N-acetyltransferase [Anaerolineae bacterium]|nr:GNAT family N-acetyltransferase [Anaerolineae bacterium]